MKIDKKNLQHWLYLFRSSTLILLTLPLRLLKKKNIVILYGHKFNGNLLALYDFIRIQRPEFDVYYLTMDPAYYQQLKQENVKVLQMGLISDMTKVARAGAIITDHGMHTLILYRYLTSIKFIDVWHGLFYKGFDMQTFKHLHGHDEVWVQSETMKWFYINKFGFSEDQVRVTGYGRADRLFLRDYDRGAILEKYGLPDRKTVLLAPTWAQDDKNRSILPFGASMEEFFDALEEVGKRNNAAVIFRTHLNTGDSIKVDRYEHVRVMPSSNYPVAEEFLYISDILITDWSSIAIDYLALKRPTLFLDVPAPFSKGFTLGPEHRFGEIVDSLEKLTMSIEKYINRPEAFLEKYENKINNTIKAAYGSTLDGKARDRYIANLVKLLNIEQAKQI
ncbi:MAG: CDP-glycerol glycerophosphotransferase family protein [Desulfosalsimonas sp.]